IGAVHVPAFDIQHHSAIGTDRRSNTPGKPNHEFSPLGSWFFTGRSPETASSFRVTPPSRKLVRNSSLPRRNTLRHWAGGWRRRRRSWFDPFAIATFLTLGGQILGREKGKMAEDTSGDLGLLG